MEHNALSAHLGIILIKAENVQRQIQTVLHSMIKMEIA
jgi:hypothetical protein